MSYPVKYRERTIEYRQEGHTLEETSKTFKVAISTIRKWEKQYKEEGDLAPKKAKRSFRKLDPAKLKAYVEEHPDAYQKEIAKELGCSRSNIQKAMARLKITRKKNKQPTRSKTPGK